MVTGYSEAAVRGCWDATKTLTTLDAPNGPPESVFGDLVNTAPEVRDAGLVTAFKAFTSALNAKDAGAGLNALTDIGVSCSDAGLYGTSSGH
jgi:hypothetical protein